MAPRYLQNTPTPKQKVSPPPPPRLTPSLRLEMHQAARILCAPFSFQFWCPFLHLPRLGHVVLLWNLLSPLLSGPSAVVVFFSAFFVGRPPLTNDGEGATALRARGPRRPVDVVGPSRGRGRPGEGARGDVDVARGLGAGRARGDVDADEGSGEGVGRREAWALRGGVDVAGPRAGRGVDVAGRPRAAPRPLGVGRAGASTSPGQGRGPGGRRRGGGRRGCRGWCV